MADKSKENTELMVIDNKKAELAIYNTENALQKATTSMGEMYSNLGKNSSDAGKTMMSNYSGIQEKLNSLGGAATRVGKAVKDGMNGDVAKSIFYGAKTIDVVMGMTSKKTKKQSKDISNSFIKLSGASDRIGQNMLNGFGNVASGFLDVAKNAVGSNEEFTAAMADLQNTVNGSLGEAFSGVSSALAEDLMPRLGELAERYIPMIGEMVDAILPPIMGIIDTILPILEGMLDSFFPMFIDTIIPGIIEGIERMTPMIKEIVEQVLPVILNLFAAMFPFLMQIIEAILPVVVKLLELLLPPLMHIIEFVLPIIVSLISGISVVVQGLVENILARIELFKFIFTVMVNFIKEKWNKMKKGITNVIKWILEKVVNKFTEIKETISSIFEALAEVVSNVWNGIWETIKGIVNSILGGIEGMVNGVVNGINVLLSGIGTVVSAVGDVLGMDWSVSLLSEVSLPRLAKGGVLEKGQIGFLEGDGAEAVVPLEKNKEWISKVSNEFKAQGMGDDRTLSVLEQIVSSIYELKNENEILPERIQDAIANGLRFDVDNREFGRMVRKVRMS